MLVGRVSFSSAHFCSAVSLPSGLRGFFPDSTQTTRWRNLLLTRTSPSIPIERSLVTSVVIYCQRTVQRRSARCPPGTEDPRDSRATSQPTDPPTLPGSASLTPETPGLGSGQRCLRPLRPEACMHCLLLSTRALQKMVARLRSSDRNKAAPRGRGCRADGQTQVKGAGCKLRPWQKRDKPWLRRGDTGSCRRTQFV